MKIVLPKNQNCKNVPTNYILLSDSSGSMYGSISQLRDTIASVVDMMAPEDTITIGDFSSYGDYDFFVRGLPVSNKNIASLVKKKIRDRGLTCYVQALGEIGKIVEDVRTMTGNDNFAFYFLSDGYPNDRSPTSEILNICSKLKGKFVSANIVGYGSYYNRQVLQEMAEKIGGTMAHISSYREIKPAYEKFFTGETKKKINVPVDRKYDLIWQVTDSEIVPLEQEANNSVNVFESKNATSLFAINYDELDKLQDSDLTENAFVYSLAFLLSQKNKANLAVSVLRKAGQGFYSKMLVKAFTVASKGRAENELKARALAGGITVKVAEPNNIKLTDFLKNIEKNFGKIAIDMSKSEYSSISRKNTDVSKVEFELTDKVAPIVSITGNENRPNISFLTARKGRITKINDADLANRIKEHNKTVDVSKRITLPIESVTFRNYAFVANGDFNFDKITLVNTDGSNSITIDPKDELEIFEETDKTVNIKDFTNIYKQLIAEKAHASVLNFYIKENSAQKHLVDKRVELYGEEGAKLVEEMGLDYEMRFSPKSEYVALDKENMDYVPFLEITAKLKGSATINARSSYEKYVKKGKQNPGDLITWPLFEKYDKMLTTLGKTVAVETFQSTVDGINKTVDLLKSKIAGIKFKVITTNSWFEGVDKSDKFEYDGLVVETSEEKEYL